MNKFFNRNPAMILAFISSAIMVTSSFIVRLTPDEQGTLNALALAISGCIVGWSVAADGGLAIIVGLAKAVLALGLAFGLHMTPENQAVIMSFVATGAAMFVHSQVTSSVNAAGNKVVAVDNAGGPVIGGPAA